VYEGGRDVNPKRVIGKTGLGHSEKTQSGRNPRTLEKWTGEGGGFAVVSRSRGINGKTKKFQGSGGRFSFATLQGETGKFPGVYEKTERSVLGNKGPMEKVWWGSMSN